MAGSPAATILRQALLLQWSEISLASALRLTPAIALVLILGLLSHRPAAGAIAASGALTVGFGAFQQFTASRATPMIFAVLGTTVSTIVGTLAGQFTPAMAVAVVLWGLWCGLLPAIGMGAFWVGQQCVIFLLIAAAYAGGVAPAVDRATLVLGGGLAQILCYWAIVSWQRGALVLPRWHRMEYDGDFALRVLLMRLTPDSTQFQFALRLATALLAALLTERWLAIPNGYWTAMTTLLLLRPDFHATLALGLGRALGTIGGAVLAEIIVALHPNALPLALLIILCAAFSYATLRLNYGVFSFFLTAYVILLLVSAGLIGPLVAEGRVYSTLIGGAFALAAHLTFHRRRVQAIRG